MSCTSILYYRQFSRPSLVWIQTERREGWHTGICLTRNWIVLTTEKVFYSYRHLWLSISTTILIYSITYIWSIVSRNMSHLLQWTNNPWFCISLLSSDVQSLYVGLWILIQTPSFRCLVKPTSEFCRPTAENRSCESCTSRRVQTRKNTYDHYIGTRKEDLQSHSELTLLGISVVLILIPLRLRRVGVYFTSMCRDPDYDWHSEWRPILYLSFIVLHPIRFISPVFDEICEILYWSKSPFFCFHTYPLFVLFSLPICLNSHE